MSRASPPPRTPFPSREARDFDETARLVAVYAASFRGRHATCATNDALRDGVADNARRPEQPRFICLMARAGQERHRDSRSHAEGRQHAEDPTPHGIAPHFACSLFHKRAGVKRGEHRALSASVERGRSPGPTSSAERPSGAAPPARPSASRATRGLDRLRTRKDLASSVQVRLLHTNLAWPAPATARS